MEKVNAKWGFGNAPLKDHHRAKTVAAIHVVIKLLGSLPESVQVEHLDAISHIKGQFSRTVKQDQWDWYTVWSLLGRPSHTPANTIANRLGDFRAALKAGSATLAEEIAIQLPATEILRYFDNFLAGGRDGEWAGGSRGFLYVFSTRSHPHWLKIGITQRTVELRVKEINAATGVVIPYGVRAVWKVENAPAVERDIHTLLAAYRIRGDREFFEIEFNAALRIINDYLISNRMLKRHDRTKRGLR
jgi:hypothetical protein